MAKIRYEVDPHNRLVLKRTGKESRIGRYRTVLDGRFRIGSKNLLIYHGKIPAHTKKLQQIKLKGKWSLNKSHDLVLTLNKWGNQIAKNKLIIKAALINAGRNQLVFAVTTREISRKRSIYLLKLSGKYKVDKNNRFSFDVGKDKKADSLLFQGSWKLKNNSILYSYKKYLSSKTKKDKQNLVFSGYWDIKNKYRLSYIMDKTSGSDFDFRTSAAVPIKQKGKSGLKYELGTGILKNKRRGKTIVIFGKWKIKKDIGLVFEIRYGNNTVNLIIFGATIRINKDYSLTMDLKSKDNKDLGIRLQLSRRFFKQHKAFLRLILDCQEKAIELGGGLRW